MWPSRCVDVRRYPAGVTEPTAPAPDDAPPQGRQGGRLWIGGLLAVAALVVVGLVVNVSRYAEDPSGDARTACRGYVTDQLVAPATARFTGEHVTSGGGEYTVTGDVDAQNVYGALLRHRYTCVVQAGTWDLVSLTGLD